MRARRILVIDDEDGCRRVLKEILEHDGHEVVEASDGEEGLAAFKQNEMDLVVTDVIMPGMSGLDFLASLLRQDSDAKVIVIARMGKIVLKKAEALGAAATLSKPYTMQQMLDTVRDILS